MWEMLLRKYSLNVIFLCLLIFILATAPANAHLSAVFVENDTEASTDTVSEGIDRQRLLWVTSAHAVGYTGTLLMLNHLWYKDYPRSSFHFHDDLDHWKQMDKMGHMGSAYHLSHFSYQAFRYTGMSNHQAALWGSFSGSIFLTTIEILDGFSAEWGASWSDLAANTLGSLIFYGQQKGWEEQRIFWKYSFQPSGLAQYRPDLLGSGIAEKMLKDYNAHTHWLSFNLHSLTRGSAGIPSWLNIAVGYGATGMLGSLKNPAVHNNRPMPELSRYRQFYLAPDIDLSRLGIASQRWQSFFSLINFIKIPTPAIEYNRKEGFIWHWMFF